jgi:hypothetical protein
MYHLVETLLLLEDTNDAQFLLLDFLALGLYLSLYTITRVVITLLLLVETQELQLRHLRYIALLLDLLELVHNRPFLGFLIQDERHLLEDVFRRIYIYISKNPPCNPQCVRDWHCSPP